MDLQSSFGAEKRPDAHLETLEAKTLTPEQAAKETLRMADRLATDARSQLEALKMTLDVQSPAAADIASLEDDLDAAWDELTAEIQTAKAEMPGEQLPPPPEAELDWDIPEEQHSAPAVAEKANRPSLEGKTEDELIDLINVGMDQAFTGNAEALSQLRELSAHPNSSELAGKFLADECQSRLYQTFEAPTFSAEDMSRVMHVAEISAESRNMMQEAFSQQVGPKMTERILKDPSYLGQLSSMERSLSQPLREGGPELCSKRSFRNLVALKETVGDFSSQFAQALDLKQYTPELDAELQYQASRDLIDIEQVGIDEESGELTTKIAFAINYTREDAPAASDERNGLIARNICRSVQKDSQGEPVVTKYVEHSVFKLPAGTKDAGIAAKMTKRSLEMYGADKMGLDEIRLHANIDVGGYAWASYGYGWDDESNASQRLAKLAEKGEEIIVGGREVFEYEELTPEDKKELARQEVDDIIRGSQASLDSIAASMRRRGSSIPPDLYQSLSAQVEACRLNRDVTPQDLALMGETLPKFYKSAEGEYYLEQEWEQAQAQGEKPAEGFKKPAHFGKIAMLGSNWYGKIELSQTGPQAGKNLELLQKTLERRKA